MASDKREKMVTINGKSVNIYEKYIAVYMEPVLWDKINETIPETMPMSTYLQSLVAKSLGVVLEQPEAKRSRLTGMTEEEKTKLKQEKAKEQRDLVKMLLEQHRAAKAAEALAAAEAAAKEATGE